MTTVSDRSGGFTLVEVLVALIIVALGTLAIASQIGQSARVARLTQMKTLASWIAQNKITEIRLTEGLPATGREDGEIEFSGREWYWESEVKKPPGDVENFLHVVVAVALADDPEVIVAELTGFVGRGAPQGNRRPWDRRIGDNASDVPGAPGEPEPRGGGR